MIHEPEASIRLSAAAIKWHTGSDAMSGRELYARDIKTFVPTHKLLLLCNPLPALDPGDAALWQRMVVVPFKRHYKDEPDPRKPHEGQKDKGLEGRLRANELSGIQNWLIEGARRWYEDEGLGRLPEEMAHATARFEENSHPMKRFINTQMVRGKDRFVAGEDEDGIQ